MSIVPSLQGLLLAVWPGGGQQVARRNAWAAMAADAARARSRREAQAALAVAALPAARHGTGGS